MADMNDLTEKSRAPRWVLAVIAFGLTVFGIYSATHMVAAGDTWVALACGRHFVNHGVNTVEPFSFNSHHAGPTEEDIANWPGWAQTLAKPFPLSFIQKVHPTGWINQNWLTHVIFYKLVQTDEPGVYHYDMLVYWKFALYVLTAFVVYLIGRTIGTSRVLALAAAGFAMIIGRSFFDIRPAAWSNLLVPVLIWLLALTTYRNHKLIWLLVPLVVFWANVHGGYLYAFIMLVPFIGLHILIHLPRKWTFAICSIGTWGLLYLLTYQLHNHEYFEDLYTKVLNLPFDKLSMTADRLFYILLLVSAGSLVTAYFGTKRKALFYCYHIVVSIGLFLGFLMRLSPALPANAMSRTSDRFEAMISYAITSTQIKFLVILVLSGIFTYLLTWRKERLVRVPVEGIKQTIYASIAAFVAMIIFNPFHLTNLTHTFEISVSEHAESWRKVNEWRPAFDSMDPTREGENPVGAEEAFAMFCILAGTLFAGWIVLRFLRPRLQITGKRRGEENLPPPEETVRWPKLDLALFTVGFLTVYMAIQSRRFIAIAGPAACPFIALLLDQIVRMILILIEKHRKTPVFSDTVQTKLRTGIWIGATAVLLVLTVRWGMIYNKIYVQPWPIDPIRNSIFMRMTASNVKPYEVCDFINLNQLEGRMFNYWTEGGAMAFGQEPDPKTGEIPLKLFMDGRAQAAYNHDKYRLWQEIFSGGEIYMQLLRQKKRLNTEAYTEIGQWIDQQLAPFHVWVISMPNSQRDSVFMRSITRTPNWKTVFYGDNQTLMVNIKTTQGKTLTEQILEGKATYPDDFTRHLSTAMLILETRSASHINELKEHALKAFELRACPASAATAVYAAQWSPLRQPINDALVQFVKQFEADRETLRKQAGYLEVSGFTLISAEYLGGAYPENRTHYQSLVKAIRAENNQITSQSTW